jgi:hypothetical protein
VSLREKMQNGYGRSVLTVILPIAAGYVCYRLWPGDVKVQEKLLSGFQKVAFVAAAFAVTAYNLRTRVVDFVLKVEGKPARVDDFCRIARGCGKRLTNLVVLFTLTAAGLGALTLFTEGTEAARWALILAVALFVASVVSFLYIIFSFERLERFALDDAEQRARQKESERLFR